MELHFLAWLMQQAGNHLWQSTAFAAVAFLLVMALKATQARARHWVWLCASVKFLVPFAALASLGNMLRSWIAPAAPAARVPFAVEQILRPFAKPELMGPAAAVLPPSAAAFPVPAVLLTVWFVGFAAVLFHWWNRWRRIRAAVRGALPLREGRETDALCRLRSNSDLKLLNLELVSSSARMEPGIFGIVRPVLWLPAGIANRLSDTELDAILAHELCHARRRDNLAAAVHMIVEAIFWFHPLVWWMGARLIEERERACDEEVVRLIGDPQAYAESILKVCEFYVASPLTCAAGITGADLRKRIESIMASRFLASLDLWKKLLLTALLAVAVISPCLWGVFKAEAQTAALSSGFDQNARKLEFEVASLKPTAIGPAQSSQLSKSGQLKFGPQIYGNRADYVNMSLRQLVAEAYQLKAFQVDCPNWFLSERFDVMAKMPAGSRKEDAPLMLQSLLADRLKLAVHRESREEAISGLVVGKGGPNLRESRSGGPANPFQSEGAPPERGGQAPRRKDLVSFSGMMGTMAVRYTIDPASSSVRLEASRMTMTDLAHFLMQADLGNGRPVVDMTGLKGEYEIVLDIPMSLIGGMTPTTGSSASNANAQGPRPADAALDPGSGRMMRSLKSLGLDLKKMKAPLEHLVVDHTERKPRDN